MQNLERCESSLTPIERPGQSSWVKLTIPVSSSPQRHIVALTLWNEQDTKLEIVSPATANMPAKRVAFPEGGFPCRYLSACILGLHRRSRAMSSSAYILSCAPTLRCQRSLLAVQPRHHCRKLTLLRECVSEELHHRYFLPGAPKPGRLPSDRNVFTQNGRIEELAGIGDLKCDRFDSWHSGPSVLRKGLVESLGVPLQCNEATLRICNSDSLQMWDNCSVNVHVITTSCTSSFPCDKRV